MSKLLLAAGLGFLCTMNLSLLSSAAEPDALCYMTTISGRTIDLSGMCGVSSKEAAAKVRPSFISEEKDFRVTDLKLTRSPAGLLVYISGKIQNVSNQAKLVDSVTLQLEHKGTILKQTNASVKAEIPAGKAFIFRDIVDREELGRVPLSQITVTPISFLSKRVN